MSATHAQAVGGLPAVEAVLADSARLVQALATARKVRRLLLLGLLVFLIATGVMFYRLFERIRSQENLQEVTRLAQERLAERSDVYMDEVRTLIDKSAPVLTGAFYNQAKTDLPSYMQALGEQREVLVRNLLDEFQQRMSNHYETVLSQHEAILQEELPETKDPQVRARLQHNLAIAFDRLVRKYYGDEVNGQMRSLVDAWESFPMAPEPGRDDPPLSEQFMGNLFELAKLKIVENEVALIDAQAEGGRIAAPATAPAGDSAGPEGSAPTRRNPRRVDDELDEVEAKAPPSTPAAGPTTPTPEPAGAEPRPDESPAPKAAEKSQ